MTEWEIVSFEELSISNMYEIEALIRVFVKNGLNIREKCYG